MYKNRTLAGKTVALTGSTGGIGNELCRHLLRLSARLLLLDRNQQKAQKLENALREEFKNADIKRIKIELEDIASVKSATEQLINEKPDVFIHNAGAYSIPRHSCSTGFDNVFMINFVSPYFMARELNAALPEIKIVAVGSIAHSYSKTDSSDIDFSTRQKASLVYGNAKRYLMLALESTLTDTGRLSIVHPGITFTNITAHYPPLLFAIIKHPMKIIFMKPKAAALSILEGVFTPTQKGFWIGPRIFNVWGRPKMQRLKTAGQEEKLFIAKTAEKIYKKIRLEV